ncbi:hypothetical protein GCM10017044_11730 [Kordiimonas sediminis]|uniref:DUF2207 domain-containing protein n=1 Tax=Kordiimonas sediminis TaxID=1735581 RepID=A0A919E6G6_9PROT|nr:DUF2207 domain-containing protein [Kordiimonas sediminis]GHF18841.1 hypothetical protein GCM10017044_11730 [Kordiimonas sediminis]
MRIRFSILALITLISAVAFPATAREEIREFISDIVVLPTGELQITETIRVNAEGAEIRHGIFRDFPTEYTDRNGNRIKMGFTVQSVQKDNSDVNWTQESIGNGERIRIGSANIILPRGEHTYTISYTTSWQVTHFDTVDELYWNVTGNGWAFPILKARAVIELPSGATISRTTAYTGRSGSRDGAYQSDMISDNIVRFDTTSPLGTYEGLTIVVEWPAGFVDRPTALDKTNRLFLDNLNLLAGSIGLFFTTLYFFMAWNKLGRDPKKGTIIAQYEPPEGLSPAACRYILKMRYDSKALTGAIVSAAQKGFLVIDQIGDEITLTVKDRTVPLARGEKALFDKLLPGTQSSITLKDKYSKDVAAAQTAFRKAILKEKSDYFVGNWTAYLIGAGLGMLTITSTFIAADSLAEGIPMLFALTALGIVLTRMVKSFRLTDGSLKARHLLTLVLFIMWGSSFFSGSLADYGLGAIIILGATMAVMTLFVFLMPAPTQFGRKIMDHIEGFKLYLKVAEEDRLNFHTPPEKTPELYEKYLPYAIALELENEWGAQFHNILEDTAAAQGKSSYSPAWYHGSSSFSSRSVGQSIGSSMSTIVAAAATPPSSSGSSGFSGGSGGGGGGGGGGGW